MTETSKDLREFTLQELRSELAPLGKEKYRAGQVFRWLYQDQVTDISQMTNLSKSFREELARKYYISNMAVSNSETAADGTRKFLLELSDGDAIESVLIPEGNRLTQCISTQVGCNVGCRFCLTGKGGLKRNLTMAEITGQVMAAKQTLLEGDRITNIVIMGMGEPLLNFDNCVRALSIFFHEWGLKLSSRRVTLSSSGIIPGLKKLFSYHPVRLAISLNATTEETRDYLMPINRKYPMGELLDTLRRLDIPPRQSIAFEYVMIRDINDSLDDARRLTRLLDRIPSKINLIPYNEIPDIDFKSPSSKRIDAFRDILLEKNYTVITRKSKGREISAACGQLRGRLMKKD